MPASPSPPAARRHRLWTRFAVLALLSALVLAPAYAVAAQKRKNGITPTTPKAGAVVKKGKALTFRGKYSGKGVIFIHVCKSPKRNLREGVICTKQTIGQAKRRKGKFTYTQRVYDFDEYWLNRPGTYYWQAHRISCKLGSRLRDCRREGPVVKFRVK